MKSIIKQIYSGDLCLSEHGAACVSEFRAVRDIAVKAHNAFEDKLCQPMKQEFDDYLSKESDVTPTTQNRHLQMDLRLEHR